MLRSSLIIILVMKLLLANRFFIKKKLTSIICLLKHIKLASYYKELALTTQMTSNKKASLVSRSVLNEGRSIYCLIQPSKLSW